MKKVFAIIFSLISIGSYCQDTIFVDQYPRVVTIIKIDKSFIYFNPEGQTVVRKVPLNMVKRYALYDKNRTAGFQTLQDSIKTTSENDYFLMNKNTDTVNYKIGYIRYNLGGFYKEIKTGFIISSIGFITATSAPLLIKPPDDFTKYSEYNKQIKTVSLVGLGVGLLGSAIIIDSYKWIKRASIEPTTYGMSVKIKF